MFNVGLLRICLGAGECGAMISVRMLLAAQLTVGLLVASLAPGFGEEKSAGMDAEPSGRLAQRTEPKILVASALLAEPASQISVIVEVVPRASLPIAGFIRVRGLPQFASINDGYAIGPGAWAVPLYALPVLRLNIPTAIFGPSELEVALVNADGRILAEAHTSLIVAPPSGLDAAPQLAAPAAAAVEMPSIGQTYRATAATEGLSEKKRAEELVSQGERYLPQGKLAAARLFFRQAAELGLAAGALRLAATYDPAELSILKVQGIAPDPIEARKWYERARELGAAEAEGRLARLNGK
jgi:hypothetical protein